MTSKLRSWTRVLTPLAVSLLFFFQPQGAFFDERRWALCLLPWLVLCGFPTARAQERSSARGDALRRALSMVAVALPVLGLALSFGPGVGPALRSAWLLPLGAILIFLIALAAERARSGTRRERLAHAAGWLVLIPLPVALSLALQFSEPSPRSAMLESAVQSTPLAVLASESLVPPTVAFARLDSRERGVLVRHGAFEGFLEANPEAESSARVGLIFRDVVPSVATCLLLLALSCCGGRSSKEQSA